MSALNQANILDDSSKDNSLLVIAFGVVIGHILLLLWVIFTHSTNRPPPLPVKQRLVVQTVALNPPKMVKAKVIAMQDAEPIKKESFSDANLEKKEDKPIELEPIPYLTPQSQEKAISPPPQENPALIPEIQPAPEIKKEVIKSPEEPKPNPSPEKKTESNPQPAKKITPKPEVKKTEIKKSESKKNVSEAEKKSIKNVPVKDKPPAKETEAPKKASSTIKPAEKKTMPTAPVAARQDKPKKIEIDQAAIERQKKLEAERLAAKAKQQKLISQAQETIAKIDKSRDKVSRTNFSDSALVASPSTITALQIDSLPAQGGRQQLSTKEISYRDELAGRLKLLLKLPDYGEVKIKLTLESSGKVSNVVIVSSASTANRKYIEKTLQTLTFPAFGTNFDQSPQHTFSITLCNDM